MYYFIIIIIFQQGWVIVSKRILSHLTDLSLAP